MKEEYRFIRTTIQFTLKEYALIWTTFQFHAKWIHICYNNLSFYNRRTRTCLNKISVLCQKNMHLSEQHFSFMPNEYTSVITTFKFVPE